MRSQKGSSLIEIVVAMLIMALLVTGLNACMVTLINSNVSAKELSAATSSGNQLLEELRRTDYQSVLTGSDVVREKYVRSWTVTTDDSKKRVDLVVFWPQHSTRQHAVQFSTIIARP